MQRGRYERRVGMPQCNSLCTKPPPGVPTGAKSEWAWVEFSFGRVRGLAALRVNYRPHAYQLDPSRRALSSPVVNCLV